MTYAIRAEGLVKRYGDTTALDGVDLDVRTGTVLGLFGPNGAGKTTAVRILATLLQPDAERGLLTGGAVAAPLLESLAWALGLALVFAPLAVRAFKRRV